MEVDRHQGTHMELKEGRLCAYVGPAGGLWEAQGRERASFKMPSPGPNSH